jgi:hypothetical protein
MSLASFDFANRSYHIRSVPDSWPREDLSLMWIRSVGWSEFLKKKPSAQFQACTEALCRQFPAWQQQPEAAARYVRTNLTREKCSLNGRRAGDKVVWDVEIHLRSAEEQEAQIARWKANRQRKEQMNKQVRGKCLQLFTGNLLMHSCTESNSNLRRILIGQKKLKKAMGSTGKRWFSIPGMKRIVTAKQQLLQQVQTASKSILPESSSSREIGTGIEINGHVFRPCCCLFITNVHFRGDFNEQADAIASVINTALEFVWTRFRETIDETTGSNGFARSDTEHGCNCCMQPRCLAQILTLLFMLIRIAAAT